MFVRVWERDSVQYGVSEFLCLCECERETVFSME